MAVVLLLQSMTLIKALCFKTDCKMLDWEREILYVWKVD